MRILKESIQDIENYLKGRAVDDLIDTYGSNFSDFGSDVPDHVSDQVFLEFGEEVEVVEVVVCKVIDDEVDIISQEHPVIKYNGNYYDYNAQEFDYLFSNLITRDRLPVIQKVINSDNQISERLSSVKGYVLLGY